MDLNVGQHCSVASCNVNDLLPIQCLRCKSHFCREHFGIDHHDCTSGTSTANDGSSGEHVSAWVKRSTCGFSDCNKPTLASAFDVSGPKSDSALNDALCPQCSEAFCVTHRYPDAHACKGTTNSTSDVLFKASQVEVAKALLAKNFPETSKALGSTSTAPAAPTSASITKSKQPKDPAKLAKFKAVELIKMRHKASSGDPKDKNISVALDRRVHLYVSNEAGGEGQPVLLWFRKDLICGRILDLLDVRFGLTQTRTVLVVTGEDDSEGDAQLDKSIGEQASDGRKLIIRARA